MAMTAEETLRTGEINPDFAVLWEKYGSRYPNGASDLAAIREAAIQRKNTTLSELPSASDSGVAEEDTSFTARDGYNVPIRLHRPLASKAPSPLLVMFHGGGFCMGNLDSEGLLCRQLASRLGITCVNVDYRLAPEHPFPVPVNDCWDASRWAYENASRLGAETSAGFILAGTSAGGNMADVCAHLARDDNTPVTGLLLMIPLLISPLNVPEKYRSMYLSHEQNAEAPILPSKLRAWFMDLYKPDLSSHLFASFTNPAGHDKMPPAYIVACGLDPLRDDAIIYEHALREAGVKTKLKVYPGLPHSFWSSFPMLPASKRFAAETVDGVEWLIQQMRR